MGELHPTLHYSIPPIHQSAPAPSLLAGLTDFVLLFLKISTQGFAITSQLLLQLSNRLVIALVHRFGDLALQKKLPFGDFGGEFAARAMDDPGVSLCAGSGD